MQTAGHTASPPAPAKTLQRSISARQDGALIFSRATPPREDLAQSYLDEVAILQEFVVADESETGGPTAEEVDEIVQTVLRELGLTGGAGKEMGRVIKEVVQRSGASGKLVSAAVKRAAI